jgi:hypothetical protein
MSSSRKDLPKPKRDTRAGEILVAIQPLISMVVLSAGLVVWAFNTFAQITYVEKQYSEIRANQEAMKRVISDQEDKLKIDAHQYSDATREKVLPAVNDLKEGLKEVKESVKSLESRLLVPISSMRSK